MSALWKRVTPLLASLAVLALAAPVLAQREPGDPGQPSRGREVCLPLGTALAVLTADTTLAKIIAPAGRLDSAGAVGNAGRVITLDGPAAVGACAQAQAYWAEGAGGPVVVTLELQGASTAANAALAGDGYKAEKTGPAIEGKGLKALTKLEAPGTYAYVAVLSVTAGAPSPSAARLTAQARDAVKVPFTVLLRGKGSLSGVVTDADGKPIAGARVRASGGNATGPRVGGAALPIEPPAVLGGITQDRAPANSAVTNERGEYTIALASGKYVVVAELRGYRAQWYDHKDSAVDATPVEVADQATVKGVDFQLAAASDRPNPRPTTVPGPTGKIGGTVRDAAGNPVAGAQVSAGGPSTVRPRAADEALDEAPDQVGSRGNVAVTDAEGHYELTVPVGKWIVSARGELYKPQWYNGKEAAQDATPIEVVADGAVGGVDFSLTMLPHATLSGHVSDAAGAPVAHALVKAVQRPALSSARPGGDGRSTVVYTDENGDYQVIVVPGVWAIGAGPAPTSGARDRGPTVWWDGKPTLDAADLLTLADGDSRTGIDFKLP
jgi:protocatechuate 3,4-dioxygenase beta subunit